MKLLLMLAIIQATSTGTWLGKPPLAIHSFDVTLQNPSHEARWLILPRSFGEFARGDESEVQIYKLSAKVTFAYGVSSNFQAVKLPANGSITLRDLKIESWNHPKSVELEVLIAKSIAIGEVPLERWVSESASGQDVKAPASAADPRAEKFQHPNAKFSAALEAREKVTVPIK
jgi:hypothetical protein